MHSVGEVRLVFSTTKKNLKTATPDDVKILMTNDQRLSVRDVIELYSLRWQIELFFKELKSTLGFHQYQFQKFEPVEGWVESGAHGVHVPGVVPGATDVATRLERRGETLVAASADLRSMPGGPFRERAERIAVHRRLSGNARRTAKTETTHP